jgi:hypothetical protein
MVNFREVSVGRKVMAYFKGDFKPEVDKAVEKYFLEYPYGGYLTSIEKSGENVDGGYFVHIYRLGSCD